MIDQLGNGLLLGAIIAITSVGLSLVFGVTNVFSFAHGDLVTLGAVLAVVTSTGALGLPVWAAAIVAVAAGAAIGAGLELSLFRPLRRRGVGGVAMLVTTLALSLIIRYGLLTWIGPDPQALPIPPQQVHSYAGLRLTPMALFVIIASVLILVLLGVFLLRSRLGTAMRAVSNNRTLAAASGINVDRIMLVTWALGTGLATLGGVMAALTQLVSWDMGAQILLLMFAGVILGGLGSPFGAMAGGFVIGVAAQLSVALPALRDHNDLKYAVALAVMTLVLLVRPQGLLGRKARLS